MHSYSWIFRRSEGSAIRGHVGWLSVCVSCLILIGCASTVPHKDQVPGIMEGTPCGLYAVTVHVRGIGPFCGSTTALLAAEPTDDGFRANSRPRAVGDLLGGVPGLYVNLIGDERVPGGAFLHWHGPAPAPDRVVRTILESPRADLNADFYSYDRPIELRPLTEERLFGLMTIEPATEMDFAKSDYSGLIDRIAGTLEAHLFDPAAYNDPATEKFLKQLRKASMKARDDAEFVMAWMLCSRHLPFSHCYIGRKLDPEFEKRLSETSAIAPTAPGKGKAITVTGDEIVTLRIRSFEGDSYDAIDSAFEDIVARNPQGLVVDLRENPGGTYISGRVASHLIETEISMGVFFDRTTRAKVLAGDLEGFPRVKSISSKDEFDSLIQEHGAFVGTVEPVGPIYRGPVAVVTDSKTASACEPLAAGLQEIGRAIVVGERTAASMLWTTGYNVGDGWMVWIPTVDYLTGEGVRLDGVGVIPDIETDGEEAEQAAREALHRELE